jgi:transmembrane sensor
VRAVVRVELREDVFDAALYGLLGDVQGLADVPVLLFLSEVKAANYYSTPVGGFATVPLADGSTISLNTETRRAADDLQVYVTAGTVRLTTSPEKSAAGSVSLDAGMMANTEKAAIQVSQETPAQLEDALSWRTGFVTFHNTGLLEAVAEFNRYRLRKIVIVDPSIASLRIDGKFRSSNADAFLWLLQKGFPVKEEEEERGTVLKRRL